MPSSRRAVVAGLAWSAPAAVVAASAPAFAVSPRCLKPATVTWNSTSYRRSSETQGTYTVADPDGTAGPLKGMTVTVKNTFTGTNTSLSYQYTPAGSTTNAGYNLTAATRSPSIGGATGPLALHQSPKVNTNKSENLTNANKTITTFTFTQPVTSLSFSITDIDSAASDFRDAVALVSATPYTATIRNTATVTGNGTLGTPWRAVSRTAPVPDSSTDGTVDVRFAGTVKEFQIHYWNIAPASQSASDVDGDQAVFVSNLQLTYDACS
ncbi:hypothetical protein M3C89_008425 [Micrococcus luteus]|nr:hypothetical protein [Micrococcus luteus]MCV7721506.1 hypothetical protein [Micrococcus luteus]